MKQTTKTLLGLLALLLVAGAIGGAAIWAGKDEEKKAEDKEKSEKLFDFDKAKVKSLRLEKAGKLVAALAKDDKGWKIAEPVQAEGDDASVDGLLTSLAGLKQKKDLGDEKDAKAYGFDAPKLLLSLKLDDGKEQGVQLGVDKPKATVKLSVGAGKDIYARTVLVGQAKAGAVTQKTYAKRDDSPVVYEVDAQILKDLEKDLFELQDKTLVHADREAIRKFVFEGPAGKIEVTRTKSTPADGGTADEQFAVAAPQKGPAKKWN